MPLSFLLVAPDWRVPKLLVCLNPLTNLYKAKPTGRLVYVCFVAVQQAHLGAQTHFAGYLRRLNCSFGASEDNGCLPLANLRLHYLLFSYLCFLFCSFVFKFFFGGLSPSPESSPESRVQSSPATHPSRCRSKGSPTNHSSVYYQEARMLIFFLLLLSLLQA